jgi:hypothetical protein
MIALDPFALLKSIAAAPATFAPVEGELETGAVAAIRKLITAKDMTLAQLRAVNDAIGADTLGFILGHDSIKDSDIKALVKRLDRQWAQLDEARIDALRDHLLDLAAGTAQPAGRAEPALADGAGAKAKPKAMAAEWTYAMSARVRTVT